MILVLIVHMARYVPSHERPPYFGAPPSSGRPDSPTPRYVSPDRDAPGLTMSEGYSNGDAGPSKKRPRSTNDDHHTSYQPRARHVEPPPSSPAFQDLGSQAIIPSIFGVGPRNEFTRTIGEFILSNARGREHVEVEIKLGRITSAADHARGQRIKMPSLTETSARSLIPMRRV